MVDSVKYILLCEFLLGVYPVPSTVQQQSAGVDSALEQRSANFVCTGPASKYFRLVSHKISVATVQLCCCHTKAAIDNTKQEACLGFNKTLFTQAIVCQPLL